MPSAEQAYHSGVREPSHRRAEHDVSTRRALQDAALHLAETQGIAATTVDQIAELAGVSRRTFFRYFASKLDAAIGDHVERVRLFRRLLAAPAGNRGPIEHCFAAAQGVLEPVWADPELLRRRYRTIRKDPALRDHTRATDGEFERLVAAQVEPAFPGPAGSLHARMFAAAGLAAVNYTVEEWATRDDVDAAAEIAAAFADLERAAMHWIVPSAAEAVTSVVVLTTSLDPASTLRLVQDAVRNAPSRTAPAAGSGPVANGSAPVANGSTP